MKLFFLPLTPNSPTPTPTPTHALHDFRSSRLQRQIRLRNDRLIEQYFFLFGGELLLGSGEPAGFVRGHVAQEGFFFLLVEVLVELGRVGVRGRLGVLAGSILCGGEGWGRLTVRMMESASSIAIGRMSARALILEVHFFYGVLASPDGG